MPKRYDFDEVIDRKGTHCYKHDAAARIFGREDILPLWVADTDFRVPDFIMDAIRMRTEHEILGYTFKSESYYTAIIDWMQRRHDWHIEKDWISSSPGVVAGLSLAVQAFTEKGDGVIVQPPVYFPFFDTVTGSGRRLLENPLQFRDGRYTFDLQDLRRKAKEAKALLLCSPHNPGGTVWTPEELQDLMQICLEENVLVISDEIHCDLCFPGYRHRPIASLSAEAAANTVTLMAPSKTFNVAGLASSLVIISNEDLRRSYEECLSVGHLGMGNIFGTIALEAAFRHGDEWLRHLMDYLHENYVTLKLFLNDRVPKIRIMKPEATYLVWMDFSAFGLDDDSLQKILVEKAGVGLNPGQRFGPGGEGWMRINIGCPRSVLKEALQRIADAFEGL